MECGKKCSLLFRVEGYGLSNFLEVRDCPGFFGSEVVFVVWVRGEDHNIEVACNGSQFFPA